MNAEEKKDRRNYNRCKLLQCNDEEEIIEDEKESKSDKDDKRNNKKRNKINQKEQKYINNMEMHVFELNLIRTIEDNETCKIENEIEREKNQININRLNIKNDKVMMELKNKIKEIDV